MDSGVIELHVVVVDDGRLQNKCRGCGGMMMQCNGAVIELRVGEAPPLESQFKVSENALGELEKFPTAVLLSLR